MSDNAAMNAFLAGAVRSQRSRGLLERMSGASVAQDRRGELNETLAAIEHAIKTNDAAARELHEVHLDRLLEEARQAHAEAAKAAEPHVSFDGGVRGRGTIAPPAGGLRAQSSRSLFAQALAASHAERRDRS